MTDSINAEIHDFIILGSGAAGLTAAVAAKESGIEPVVFEKASTFGGTTAISGGGIWVPCNHHQESHGVEDSRASARKLMVTMARGRSSDELIDTYLDESPEMIREVEAWFDQPFELLTNYPDYQAELAGGMNGGRALDNPIFQTHELGALRDKLRKNPITGRAPITITEATTWGVFSKPMNYPAKEVYQRYKDGFVHGGAALIGRLLKAAAERNIRMETDAAGTRLIHGEEGIEGVIIERDGVIEEHYARFGVLIATGGFEWNADLCARFLQGIPAFPATPPSCEGDGLIMAQRVGAKLANMTEAWWCPAVQIPGEEYDGAPLARSEFSSRCLPHSIIVNRHGRRFVNESLNYNDVGKPFWNFDSSRYESANQPAWLIADANYLERYVFITAVPGREIPDYLTSAPSLDELASATGIDSAGLVAEVERFNQMSESGRDLDFLRGEGAFDRFYGDADNTPNPNLGPLTKPPFVAVPLYAGTIGTKGGPECDRRGRVLDVDDCIIPGLYAAGNAAASPAGEGYPGAGITIGAAMCFGWLAARDAAAKRAETGDKTDAD